MVASRIWIWLVRLWCILCRRYFVPGFASFEVHSTLSVLLSLILEFYKRFVRFENRFTTCWIHCWSLVIKLSSYNEVCSCSSAKQFFNVSEIVHADWKCFVSVADPELWFMGWYLPDVSNWTFLKVFSKLSIVAVEMFKT